jgi:hypothetical protein
MKGLQLGFALVVGVVYVLFSVGRPDLRWPLRIGVLVLIAAFFIVTNLLRGRPALESNNPLEADEAPSLNLSSAGMNDSSGAAAGEGGNGESSREP